MDKYNLQLLITAVRLASNQTQRWEIKADLFRLESLLWDIYEEVTK